MGNSIRNPVEDNWLLDPTLYDGICTECLFGRSLSTPLIFLEGRGMNASSRGRCERSTQEPLLGIIGAPTIYSGIMSQILRRSWKRPQVLDRSSVKGNREATRPNQHVGNSQITRSTVGILDELAHIHSLGIGTCLSPRQRKAWTTRPTFCEGEFLKNSTQPGMLGILEELDQLWEFPKNSTILHWEYEHPSPPWKRKAWTTRPIFCEGEFWKNSTQPGMLGILEELQPTEGILEELDHL